MSRFKPALVTSSIGLLCLPAWSSTENTRSADWTWPPMVVFGLVLVALLYLRGTFEMTKKPVRQNWRPAMFFILGWSSLLIALDSPIHEIGEQLFWVHMTQHEILMLVSAPLLVLARPLLPFLYAMPSAWRSSIARSCRSYTFQRSWKVLSAPLTTWLLSAAALWIWHVPWLFDRTLRSDWTHAAQHTTFLISGLLFWWPLVNKMSAL